MKVLTTLDDLDKMLEAAFHFNAASKERCGKMDSIQSGSGYLHPPHSTAALYIIFINQSSITGFNPVHLSALVLHPISGQIYGNRRVESRLGLGSKRVKQSLDSTQFSRLDLLQLPEVSLLPIQECVDSMFHRWLGEQFLSASLKKSKRALCLVPSFLLRPERERS